MGNEKEQKLFEMLFLQMVMSLNEAAMTQMGKILNPATGKIEKDLIQAQGTIDLLRMLKEKTANNLSDQEHQVLNQSIMKLEMHFVNEKETRAQASQTAGSLQDELENEAQSRVTDAGAVGESQNNDDNNDPNDMPGNRPGMNN